MNSSRKIPLPIQREVRQKCGFGCIICGCPIYDYDHIEEWAEVKEHKTENLILLCCKHHREKTNGLLTKEQVLKYAENPFNIKNDLSSTYLFRFEGENFMLKFGELEFVLEDVNPNDDFLIPFLINEKKLISFEIKNGKLFFNLVLFDKQGNRILIIENNELIYKSNIWDIEFVGKNLKVRQGNRDILLDIDFNIPNCVQINQAYFKYEGVEIIIKNGTIMSKNLRLTSKRIIGARVLMAFGKYNSHIHCPFHFGI